MQKKTKLLSHDKNNFIFTYFLFYTFTHSFYLKRSVKTAAINCQNEITTGDLVDLTMVRMNRICQKRGLL